MQLASMWAHEICAGLRKLLEPENEVIGSVGDGRTLLKAAADLKPDLVIVDIGMPLLNGLDAVRELRKSSPSARIVFLTMNMDSDVASEALRIGASGYLLKTSREEELLQAIRNAMKGTSYVSSQIRDALEESFIRDPRSRNRSRHLTNRQLQVLQMLAEGRSMKEIATILVYRKNKNSIHRNIAGFCGISGVLS